MDARSHERVGPGIHGLVGAAKRLAFALPIAALLACAVLGGLVRAGALSWAGAVPPLAHAALDHAALMIGAFMGAVIAIERCVALKWRSGWLAPAACVAAGGALMSGLRFEAALLLLAGSAVFLIMNVAIVARQAAWHTALLLAGAACWLAVNGLYAAGGPPGAVASWWFAFLVMTIAAERLEMTRLMRARPGARASLALALGLLALGAALAAPMPAAGGALYGASLVALAAWLLRNDIAWRTVRAHGLPRYMAVCLLGGYAWLLVAGLAWASWSLGGPGRDVALHALGLGFVFSMMMGHAPVILPAIARIKVSFGAWFYLPLAALHGSLVFRFLGDAVAAGAFATGARMNATAILLFLLTVIVSAVAWHFQHREPPNRRIPS